MITAGVDVGAKTVKVVIVKDGQVLSRSSALSGRNKLKVAEDTLEEAVKKAGIERQDIQHIAATGAGAKRVTFADHQETLVAADARGVVHLLPRVRTVADIGANQGWAVRCDATGKVKDFALNEQCAAGAGTFVETIARVLELNLEDMGPLSLKSQKTVPMNAQCCVFGESEAVSLLHARTPKEDIARAVHNAMTSRVAGLVRMVGIEPEVALIGGVARNIGFVDSLKKALGVEVLIPDEPEYVSALGAALDAAASN